MSTPATRPDAESTRLPDNAYRPLETGEQYLPIVPASQAPPESTWRAVSWGVLLCVLFTVASAYSGLKVGQVMEASIPISILAIGLARVYRRRSTLLENVILKGRFACLLDASVPLDKITDAMRALMALRKIGSLPGWSGSAYILGNHCNLRSQ